MRTKLEAEKQTQLIPISKSNDYRTVIQPLTVYFNILVMVNGSHSVWFYHNGKKKIRKLSHRLVHTGIAPMVSSWDQASPNRTREQRQLRTHTPQKQLKGKTWIAFCKLKGRLELEREETCFQITLKWVYICHKTRFNFQVEGILWKSKEKIRYITCVISEYVAIGVDDWGCAEYMQHTGWSRMVNLRNKLAFFHNYFSRYLVTVVGNTRI